MKREVLVDAGLVARDRALDAVESRGNFRDIRSCCAFCSQAGGFDLDSGAQFHDLDHFVQ
jgi:hypothetical protein